MFINTSQMYGVSFMTYYSIVLNNIRFVQTFSYEGKTD